ncbi:MAG: hypothetical protein M0017_01960 [Desulfobacteraceae bacterium]|nr:hypothetical protein [Desulfobacteraceae bacterium]
MKPSMLVLVAAVLVSALSLHATPAGAAESPGDPDPARETAAAAAAPSEYSGLAGLVSSIAAQAAEAFRGFYDPSPVRVRPFVHVSAMANDSSALGVMLADQLAAMLNGDANASYARREGKGQRLEGMLQEVDGYLRIHIIGTNAKGERRSHVALVEMSAPLYRALNTYAETR